MARDIVLDAPTTIALAECACRAVAKNHGEYDGHCGPLESCLYLGDPIASFVVEKQPATSRFITVEEALGVIDNAASRGNLHSLWFKDAAAGRMYAICNCCSCCCIGLKAEREGFSPLASSGFIAEVRADACTGCGSCVSRMPLRRDVDGRGRLLGGRRCPLSRMRRVRGRLSRRRPRSRPTRGRRAGAVVASADAGTAAGVPAAPTRSRRRRRRRAAPPEPEEPRVDGDDHG